MVRLQPCGYAASMEPDLKTVLHVGCGAKTIKQMPAGFRDGSWRELRFDIDPGARPHIVGTIQDMAGVATESVDALYSSHNIEHVHAHEVNGVLREFRRVLRPTGFMVITCPDLQCLAEYIAQGKLEAPLYQSAMGPVTPIDILYGHSASIAGGQHYMAHKTGFSSDTLQQHAVDAGFSMMLAGRLPARRELWLVAPKTPLQRDAMIALFESYGQPDVGMAMQ